MRKELLLGVAVACMASASATQSAAQQTTAVGLEEVVVTAQRREESSQTAPIALSVVSEADLERARVMNPNQLMTLVPALQASSQGSNTNFWIRGVGANVTNIYTDAGVAFNYDGVYIGRPSATGGYFYDLQRIEVLKGPQGTLYGRNATGGAINVIPHAPVLGEFSGEVTGEIGNYDLKRALASVNIPMGENSALRVAGQVVDRDGYFDDGTDDDEGQALRVQFLTQPNDDLSIRLSGDYYHRGGKGPGTTFVTKADPVFGPGGAVVGYTFTDTGISRSAGMHNAASDALISSRFLRYLIPGAGGVFATPQPNNEFNNEDFWGFNAEFNWKTSLGTLTVLPAYRHADRESINYVAGFGSIGDETTKQKSVEVRLASDNDQPLRYILGGYYFDQNSRSATIFDGFVFASYQPLTTGVESVAAFGRLTWEVAPGMRLNGGLRYTRDKRDLTGTSYTFAAGCAVPAVMSGSRLVCPGGGVIPTALPGDLGLGVTAPFHPALIPGTTTLVLPVAATTLNDKLTDDAVTWRIGAEWDVRPQSLLYASYETGFRSGGFFFTSDPDRTFDPERVGAFTLGSKNRFLHNRLQLNLEAFYWKYKNQQISHFSTNAQGGTVFVTENVGRSVNKGFEVEARFLLTENTLLGADVQYLKARYKEFVYNDQNQGVPPVNGCPYTLASPTSPYTIDCSGRTPPRSPKWTLNLSAQQTFPLGEAGSLIANVDTRYQTKTLSDITFTAPEVEGANWTSNASLTYEPKNERWSVTAFVSNIENNRVATSLSIPSASLGLYVGQFLPPRTYGMRVSANF